MSRSVSLIFIPSKHPAIFGTPPSIRPGRSTSKSNHEHQAEDHVQSPNHDKHNSSKHSYLPYPAKPSALPKALVSAHSMGLMPSALCGCAPNLTSDVPMNTCPFT